MGLKKAARQEWLNNLVASLKSKGAVNVALRQGGMSSADLVKYLTGLGFEATANENRVLAAKRKE